MGAIGLLSTIFTVRLKVGFASKLIADALATLMVPSRAIENALPVLPEAMLTLSKLSGPSSLKSTTATSVPTGRFSSIVAVCPSGDTTEAAVGNSPTITGASLTWLT